MASDRVPLILIASTIATGIVDAVSFLAFGRVFTANMTGNVVLLGFAIGGAPDLSVSRCLLALGAFAFGAIAGGRLSLDVKRSPVWMARAFAIEAILLGVASAVVSASAMNSAIAVTALAMGLRNAAVRKLAVPDLTTTVLTLTITGAAADSSLAGGTNPRWQRRLGSVVAMIAGAIAGAFLLRISIALPLAISAVTAAACAIAFRNQPKENPA